MKILILLSILFSFNGLTKDLNVNFLIFGDSGYHQDFPKPDEIDGLTMEDWIKEAIEGGDIVGEKPILPPLVLNPYKKKHYFEEGGAFYVGKSMKFFCNINPCEFSLMLGDNIYPAGAQGDGSDEKRFRQLIYLPFKNIEKKNKDFRFYVVMGNHDWYPQRGKDQNPDLLKELAYRGIYSQMEYFARPDSRFILNPESSDPKRKTYYKFSTNEGRVEFFGLDTMMILNAFKIPEDSDPNEFEDNYTPTSKEDLEEMLRWLKEGLKESKAEWKIVFGHHPLYSVGGTKFNQSTVLREQILDTLCNYADIYIAGHEHDLEYHVAPCGDLPDLELLVSGAASKQRSVGVTPMSKKLIKEQARQYQFGKGMIWGFAHMSIKNNNAIVELLEVDRRGVNKSIFKKGFINRSKFLPKK